MRRLLSLFLVMLLPGCALIAPKKPIREIGGSLTLPEMWRFSGEGSEGQISTGWLSTFQDADMSALVAEALERNQNIRISAMQLEIARDNLVIARAPRLPSFGLGGSGSLSGNRVRGDDGDLSGWRNSESYGYSGSLSWEIDLWGRLKDIHDAAKFDLVANEADFRGARLSLAATVARAWCNLIAAKQQLDLAKQTLSSFEANFRITERLYKAGDQTTSPLSVQFAGNNVASAKRSVSSRQLALDETTRTLEVLLGRYPATELDARDDLPILTDAVPAGLPSELLMRRPDLVAAANDLLASAERAQIARKDLLPSINLSGRGSAGSDRLADLIVDPTSIARSVSASLSQPVFQGGRLQARKRQAELRNTVALESFVAIALRAFREVESAMAREQSLAEQEQFQNVAVNQANLAENQANRDYGEGIIGIIQVLEAQRRAFNARNSAISLKNQRLQNRIDLHLALGGDFVTPMSEGQETVTQDSELSNPEGSL